jgi:membrane fusion protein, multidrug efflux system
MKRHSWLLVTVALVALAVAYFAWPKRLTNNCARQAQGEAGQVRVEQVTRGTMPYALRASGELQTAKRTNVISGISGIVQELRYKVGDSVSQGAIVAIIEAKELRRRVASAEANVTAARSQLAENERELVGAENHLETIQQLVKQDLIAKQEIDRARFTAETARAQVGRAMAQVAQQESMLAQARKVLGLSRLIAPIGGIVTDRMVETGSAVSNGTSILSIASLDLLKVSVRVPQQDMNVVREGMAVEVRADESNVEGLNGRVARVISDPESRGEILAEVHLLNRNHRLKPGTTVTVLISADDDQEVLFVPASAVLQVDKRDYVYTVVNGHAQLRAVVKIGERDGKAAIKSGLSEGEWIVTTGPEYVKPGKRVPIGDGGHQSCQEESA